MQQPQHAILAVGYPECCSTIRHRSTARQLLTPSLDVLGLVLVFVLAFLAVVPFLLVIFVVVGFGLRVLELVKQRLEQLFLVRLLALRELRQRPNVSLIVECARDGADAHQLAPDLQEIGLRIVAHWQESELRTLVYGEVEVHEIRHQLLVDLLRDSALNELDDQHEDVELTKASVYNNLSCFLCSGRASGLAAFGDPLCLNDLAGFGLCSSLRNLVALCPVSPMIRPMSRS